MPARHDALSLASLLGGRLEGENRPVTALADPAAPKEGAVVVLENPAQLQRLDGFPLGAVVVPADLPLTTPHPLIRVADTRLALAALSALFAPPPPRSGVSPAAHLHPSVRLGEGVSVGPGAVLGAGVVVGSGSVVGPGCVLGAGSTLGEGCLLHAHVTLYGGVHVGARTVLHSGVVLGADGFGYAFSPRGALKIHHLGGVRIGDDVEVGANTCVDRGTLGDTVVGDRAKIDNLCQIGHNVQVGPDCVIAGGSAVGGSTVLERGVVLGGAVAVTDHVRLGQGARVAGRSSVTKSVPAGETWAGYPARPHRKWVRELYLLGRLEAVWQSFKRKEHAG